MRFLRSERSLKDRLEDTGSPQSSISSVATICGTILLALFFIGFLIKPEATEEFLSKAPDWITNMKESLSIGDESEARAFDIGSIFDKMVAIKIPSLTFSIPGCPTPVFSINIIAGIIFVALMVLSCFFAPISSVTSILVNIFGWIISFRIVDSYKYLVNQGSTSWQAAGSCFWILTILYTVLLFNGLIGFTGVIAKKVDINEKNAIELSEFCLCVIGSAFLSFVFALFFNLFNWLIMGLGWAGCLFIGMVVIGLIVIILEILDLIFSN